MAILATHVSVSSPIDPGSPITYANDLAIASDGKIYFTSCTDIIPAINKAGYYDTFRAWMLGLAQVSIGSWVMEVLTQTAYACSYIRVNI